MGDEIYNAMVKFLSAIGVPDALDVQSFTMTPQRVTLRYFKYDENGEIVVDHVGQVKTNIVHIERGDLVAGA